MSEASEPDAPTSSPTRRRAATWKILGIAATAVALLVGATIPAAAAESMRVTFVRHGESAGNASGLIDTSTPGPVLTAKGQQQAEAVVGTLGVNNYDGIYASTMVRTQLTAVPLSQYLHLPTQVLPGLQEIEAGVFEGTPESQAANGYAKFPLAWTFQGNRDLRIPGSINGNEFDARVDGALKTIYDNGDRNAVVFSHGGAIMFWTMMNAQNLTMAQKLDLLRNAPLANTNYVVIEGNPEDGWTVSNWNGQQFSAEPTLEAEVQLQVRTLSRQLVTATQQVLAAFATLNPATILAAINQGFANATYSIAKFASAVTTKVVKELAKPAESAPPAVANVSTVRTAAQSEVTVSASPVVTSPVVADTTPVAASTPIVSSKSAAPEAAKVEGAKVEGATDRTDRSESVTSSGSAAKIGNKKQDDKDSADGKDSPDGKSSKVATAEKKEPAGADASKTGGTGGAQGEAA